MGKIIPSRRKWRRSYVQPGRAWAKAGNYKTSRGGWGRYTGLWIGAVAAGLLGGYGLSEWQAPAEQGRPIEVTQAQPRLQPRTPPSPAIQVETPVRPRALAYVEVPATQARQPGFQVAALAQPASGARILFGLCHVGGVSNCVVDGDTFWIDGEKVRIAGIDAPETHPSHCAEEARLGSAATGRLRALLNSGAVTMTSIDRNRDRYGRLLRNVSVNGRDVGDVLIGEGLAREYAGGRRPWC